MRKYLIAAFILLGLIASTVSAQETYFGKNKVRYKDFNWKYIQSKHFDIYYYEDAYPTAKFAATVLEASYKEITKELNYELQDRVPVFIYNSHNDFQQTNITSGLLPEGVGGFTEPLKNRIVVPFDGSYEDFRHVLHHELTHAVTFDMLYGNMFTKLLSRQRLFDVPLWFAEGYAEYSSRHGWDYWSDMYVRDATINNYLAPPEYIYGYMPYTEGQAMVMYIADKYGEDKLGEILKKGRVLLTMDRAMKAVIGVDQREFYKEFSLEMKRRYWPEIAKRKETTEISKRLTKSGEDGSFFNEAPTFSPDGDRLAIFSDKSDYTEIIMISAIDGKKIKSLVKSQRNGDLESLHSYVSGISFSPDGEKIVFVAKSKGKEALFFYDLRRDKVYLKKRLDYYNIVSPTWSPDGKLVAFSALDRHKRDLFIYNIESGEIQQITDDRFDDVSPTWLPDSRELIFSSDRPHPENQPINIESNPYASPEAVRPGDFEYGQYNLFRIDLATWRVKPVDVGPGQNKSPRVSPDGKKVAFISNRNGIDDIYVGYLDSLKYYAVTDILTGVRNISWSPDGKKIAFSAMNKGGYDIYLMKDIVPVGDDGVLEPTDFVLGKYNRDYIPPTPEGMQASASEPQEETEKVDTTAVQAEAVSDYESYQVTDSMLAQAPDSGYQVNPIDSSAADSTVAATEDSVITETGTYDDEFVYVGQEPETDPLASMLRDIPDDTASDSASLAQESPAFDSVPPLLPSGEYQIHDYKTKFAPDYVGGGFLYDTFYGLQGQTYFIFSDYLGDQQIYVATDLVNTIDQSIIQAYYFNSKHRIAYGGGFFHTKNYYLDNHDHLFSDRFYGVQGFVQRPFSMFSRLEFSLSQLFIDRKFYDFNDTRVNHSSKITTAAFSYVTDNILWGYTGPLNGRRAKVTVETGVNLFDAGDMEYYALNFDYRKYWHFGNTFSMAIRFSGGASEGRTPKHYYLGGTTNWIGSRTVSDEVYDARNLYFGQIVTPLRGYPYYGIEGDRYGLINWEFRFPMIQYLAMRFPLKLVLGNITGALFTDIGSAWFGDHFKGGTTEGGHDRLQDIKTGFGFGMRANLLGFVLLRYDLAWTTDFASVSDKPTHYFSFGADF